MATTPNSSSDGKKRYPLSITQEQFYSIYLSNPKSADYNIGVAIKFENPIEPSLLTKALNDIIVKHEILRSLFTTHDGKPLAIIEPSVIVEIPIISLKDQSPKDRRINIEKIIEGLRAESFDLGVAPLFRVALINLGDSLYVFAAIFHHIIMDGLSTILFIKELLTRYNDLNLDPNAKLEKPGYNYSHYVTKQRKLLQNDQSEILKFWKKQFHELPDPLQLPTDCPRSNMPPTIREYIFTLPQSILKGVEDLARLHGVSLFTCLLSAYQLFLNKYTHQNRIVVGVPFSARGSYESEDTLGPLIHTLPIVVDLRDNLSFTDILSINNKLILEAYKHQSLSLAKLLDELKIERSDRFPPLFQVLFNLLNLTRFSTVENKEEGVKAIPIWKESGRAAYDLSLEIDLDGDNPEIVLKYNSDLFKSDTVKSMAERFLYLLQEITASPSKPIGDYTLLTEGESGTLTKWNDTSAEYPLHKTLHELIEERAKLTPKSVALIFGGRKLTYKELNDKANILAKRLMGQGVTVETIVAISLERSLDTVISLLAVLKAGGAYLYLDHNNPTERLSFMLTDSGSGVLITKSEFKSKFPDYRGKFVLLDRSESLFKDTKLPVNVKTGVKPENLAYVIYTSGSTGTPKGTLIEHRGVVNCLFAIKSQVDITPKDIFLAVTALSFDVAALDYFLPLAIGARTVIAEQKNISNPRELIKLLNQYKPSAMQATPALWNMLTRAGWLGNKGFKVLTAGEALSKELAGELLERNYEIFNIYGPTEATIYTTISKITSSDNITIGKPLENIEVYIFDKDKRPVPIGITGELYIGGVGLARGYLNRPELTEKSFIAYRFQDGKEKRLYRTGDSVRYLPDGAIRYLGRIDQQIKLRGYRIELGEIESALLKIPNILQAVVVLYGSEISDKRLVAFLVLREPEDLENLDLAFELAKWLPGYMIPSNFVLIEELPLSPNGKINKDMLSSMVKTKLSVGAKTSNRSSDSNNLLEYILADIKKIISEIFPTEIPQIDEFRAFGEYGFNSITFGELSVKIGDKYSIEISPAIFYRYINSRLLANYLLATHPKRIEEIYSIAISNEPTKNESKRGDGANGSGGDIAIIGISCRVAGSPNAATFWRNLVEGRDSIGEIPPERWDWRRYVNYPGTRWGGFIEDIDKFDSDFFNIAPYEADFMDPQQRLLLESVWSAIEDAGYPASSFSGSDTAVFVGSTGSEYIMMQQLSGMEIESHAISGSAQSIAANRISYFFNLKGPSSPIDTACSSSLVATHRAIASINAGECGKAIVSGVNLLLTPNVYKGLSRMNMLSPEGRCKTFDESADGYVRGEGVISVILKPLNQALEDRDHIYAVVKGSAENHGGRTHGLTVPNPEAQSDLIVEAYGKAGIDPNTLTYIETHGTGTRLGDPIEIDGLREAFGELYKEYDKIPSDEAYCGIGSVKSNIGHLEGAAGIAGLLKVILSLRHKTIPATLHVEKPNPSIKLGSGPFYLALETKSWDLPKDRGKENFPRRAGVSSFGFGGSNAHVILEEAPKRSLDDIGAKPYYLIAISAKNPLSLRMRTHDLSDWLNLNGDADLESVAYTLNAGREHFSYRAALVVDSIQDLKLTLEQINADRNPANYFYSGNGEKYPPVSDKEIKKILDDLSRDRNLKTQDYRENLTLLASAYRNGYDLNWAALHSNGNKVRIPLPTYPFLRKRFWFSDKYFGEATQNNYSLSYYYPISLPSHSLYEENGGESVKSLCIFGNDIDLINELRRLLPSAKIVQIVEDDSYAVDGYTYRIRPTILSDYEALISDLEKSGIGIDSFLLARYTDDKVEAFEQELRELFILSQTLLRKRHDRPLRFLIPYRYKEGSLMAKRALVGFAKCVMAEAPNYFIKLLGTDDLRAIQIVRELNRIGTSREALVIYKGGGRYEERYRPIEELDRNTLGSKSIFKENGIYLITGGLGGLGFIVAQYLAKLYKAKLILTGRSQLDDDKQAKLRLLSSFGAEVRYSPGDVSIAEDIGTWIKTAKDSFNGINGIIHCAGRLRDSLLVNKSWDDIKEVSAPKITGALLLDETTANEKLDFFITFSSITASLGSVGQADYACANAFLNAFAIWRTGQTNLGARHGKTMSINWPYWSEGGMRIGDFTEKMLAKAGLKPLPTEEGLRALEIVSRLNEPVVNILYGEKNNEFEYIFDKGHPAQNTGAANPSMEDIRPLITTLVAKQTGFAEENLKLDVPLFEQGIDSILLTQALSKIEGELNCDLGERIEAILREPSIENIVAQIYSLKSIVKEDRDDRERRVIAL